ncbi:hypothetical protein BESB_079780 [Besnoitia besnoiti]|uniref:Uncharacterized protein n=1 Tax=Besnoitia besnoiti TaxID=94643 RepID=A0A2A9MEF0_BESBE|nr:hypothetical protein BESB_079780 [Besnoitia besnoiti]PFH33762.1 hypothetical protein BESB_079780 [Besnoitia besnoiti]
MEPAAVEVCSPLPGGGPEESVPSPASHVLGDAEPSSFASFAANMTTCTAQKDARGVSLVSAFFPSCAPVTQPSLTAASRAPPQTVSSEGLKHAPPSFPSAWETAAPASPTAPRDTVRQFRCPQEDEEDDAPLFAGRYERRAFSPSDLLGEPMSPLQDGEVSEDVPPPRRLDASEELLGCCGFGSPASSAMDDVSLASLTLATNADLSSSLSTPTFCATSSRASFSSSLCTASSPASPQRRKPAESDFDTLCEAGVSPDCGAAHPGLGESATRGKKRSALSAEWTKERARDAEDVDANIEAITTLFAKKCRLNSSYAHASAESAAHMHRSGALLPLAASPPRFSPAGAGGMGHGDGQTCPDPRQGGDGRSPHILKDCPLEPNAPEGRLGLSPWGERRGTRLGPQGEVTGEGGSTREANANRRSTETLANPGGQNIGEAELVSRGSDGESVKPRDCAASGSGDLSCRRTSRCSTSLSDRPPSPAASRGTCRPSLASSFSLSPPHASSSSLQLPSGTPELAQAPVASQPTEMCPEEADSLSDAEPSVSPPRRRRFAQTIDLCSTPLSPCAMHIQRLVRLSSIGLDGCPGAQAKASGVDASERRRGGLRWEAECEASDWEEGSAARKQTRHSTSEEAKRQRVKALLGRATPPSRDAAVAAPAVRGSVERERAQSANVEQSGSSVGGASASGQTLPRGAGEPAAGFRSREARVTGRGHAATPDRLSVEWPCRRHGDENGDEARYATSRGELCRRQRQDGGPQDEEDEGDDDLDSDLPSFASPRLRRGYSASAYSFASSSFSGGSSFSDTSSVLSGETFAPGVALSSRGSRSGEGFSSMSSYSSSDSSFGSASWQGGSTESPPWTGLTASTRASPPVSPSDLLSAVPPSSSAFSLAAARVAPGASWLLSPPASPHAGAPCSPPGSSSAAQRPPQADASPAGERQRSAAAVSWRIASPLLVPSVPASACFTGASAHGAPSSMHAAPSPTRSAPHRLHPTSLSLGSYLSRGSGARGVRNAVLSSSAASAAGRGDSRADGGALCGGDASAEGAAGDERPGRRASDQSEPRFIDYVAANRLLREAQFE